MKVDIGDEFKDKLRAFLEFKEGLGNLKGGKVGRKVFDEMPLRRLDGFE